MTTRELYSLANGIRAEAARRLEGKRYGRLPTEMREQAAALTRRARRAGVPWLTISAALGIEPSRLQRWYSEAARRDGESRFAAVTIVADAPATSATTLSAGSLTVALPNGVRLEGLHVADAATVLRALA